MAESVPPTPASAAAPASSEAPVSAPAEQAPAPQQPEPDPVGRGIRRRPGRHRAASRGLAGGDGRRDGAGPGRLRGVAIAAAVLGGTGLAGISAPAQAATPTAGAAVVRPQAGAPGVPAIIQPPATEGRVASYRVAFGVQIYSCVAGAWTFKAPAAHLVKTPGWRRSIHHFAGPSWQSNVDGSLVTAAKVAESAVPGAIPQLLLKVNSRSGAAGGELAKVTYIQRLDTRGGLAPTGACTDGAQRPVPYGALYVFFAPR